MAPWLSANSAGVEVVIEGVGGALLDNVRAALPLERYDSDATLTSPRIETLHEEAPAAIRRALQPFGYYRPTIDARLTAPDDARESWSARYEIERGPPLPIDAVAFTVEGPGRADEELLASLGRPDLAPGTRFDHQHYEGEKERLLGLARQLGYQDARYATHRVEVDLERYAADIRLILETGRRHVVGSVSFGASRFADSYLERYLVVEPGMPS